MPQRFLRPGLTRSRPWNACKWAVQSLFIRLLTIADDFGRFEADPAVLRGELFALRDDVRTKHVIDWCYELHTAKLVTFYEVEGRWYGQIEKWKEHARSDKSRFPSIPLDSAADVSGLQTNVRFPRSSFLVLVPRHYIIGRVNPTDVELDCYHKDSRTVLHYLNERCGRHFRETDANLKFISARLSESGVELEGIKRMVDRQCARWKGSSQEEYLRPETLFNKTKFDGYYAAKDLPVNAGLTPQPDAKPSLLSREAAAELRRARECK